ncbi:MAG: ATP-binding protein [Clostridia bacterium]|nr:ATP-binding protein [Clostridia bacterium]MDD4048349.1 ATP-binding protein [Clostridia bacterium]
MLPECPLDPLRYIGNVVEVTPSFVKIYMPKINSLPEGHYLKDDNSYGFEVGEFIIIECKKCVIFGRVTSVKLPREDTRGIDIKFAENKYYNMISTVQMLATVDTENWNVGRGVKIYPCVGSKTYSAHPQLITWVAESNSRVGNNADNLTLNIANLQDYTDTPVKLLPEQMFSRHCAILGTTGGGKSWTIAKLIEETIKYRSKVILFDPSGEFHTMDKDVVHLKFGKEESISQNAKEIVLPYTSLNENDLFSIFNPSGQQIPKIRAAMKSLKLARLEPWLTKEGVIIKSNQQKTKFEQLYRQYSSIIDSPVALFDITKLNHQIEEECVWSSNRTFPARWGGYNDEQRSECVSLLSRIEDVLSSPELSCIFNVRGKRSVLTEIDNFISNDNVRILRISLENVSFSHNAREVIANAIGRYILAKAREGCFLMNPVVLFLDEAHHFLNKFTNDHNENRLNSFELIAKEGRKFSLNICLATQQPRDIPEGVLSQMGTILVHRLINDNDREVIEKACGEFNKTLTSFLPNLLPGEAIVIGVDFPIPVTMKIQIPTFRPDSSGPDFQKYWRYNINV